MLCELQNVTRRIAGADVVRDVSLSVQHGERLLLIGANGAGKSTLLRIIAKHAAPDSGAVVGQAQPAYCGHAHGLYQDLSIKENLTLFAKLAGLNGASVARTIEQWQLQEHLDKRVRELSRGWATRAALARATLGSPDLLLLDEPTNALDIDGASCLKAALLSQPSWIVATHELAELPQLATRVVALRNGCIVADSARGSGVNEIITMYRSGLR